MHDIISYVAVFNMSMLYLFSQEAARVHLKAAITQDSMCLAKMKVVDYSLLVGIDKEKHGNDVFIQSLTPVITNSYYFMIYLFNNPQS